MTREGFIFPIPFLLISILFMLLFTRYVDITFAYLFAFFFFLGTAVMLFFRDPDRKTPEGSFHRLLRLLSARLFPPQSGGHSGAGLRLWKSVCERPSRSCCLDDPAAHTVHLPKKSESETRASSHQEESVLGFGREVRGFCPLRGQP